MNRHTPRTRIPGKKGMAGAKLARKAAAGSLNPTRSCPGARMTPPKPPFGFSLSQLKGFFPASSEIQSQNSFRVEGAGKSKNPEIVSRNCFTEKATSGVTRSRLVSN